MFMTAIPKHFETFCLYRSSILFEDNEVPVPEVGGKFHHSITNPGFEFRTLLLVVYLNFFCELLGDILDHFFLQFDRIIDVFGVQDPLQNFVGKIQPNGSLLGLTNCSAEFKSSSDKQGGVKIPWKAIRLLTLYYLVGLVEDVGALYMHDHRR